MAIDWDQFDIDVDAAAERSANATDDCYVPQPADVKALGKLLKVVQSATDRNTKINQIVNNAEEFAGVVLALTKKLI